LIATTVLAAALGGVATFPIAALAFFNWHAESSGETAWGFWALLLAGGGAGALFAISRRFPERPRTWIRRVLAVLGVPIVLGWVGLIVLVIQDLVKAKP
jgi:hypothetical protein